VNQISEGNRVDIEDVKIEKIKGDSVLDSELVQGVVLGHERAHKSMPLSVDDAKILLIDFPLEVKSPERESRLNISSPDELEAFIESEEKYLKDLADKVISSGANVVFCQKGIDDVAQYYLAKSGIFACRRIPKSDLEKLARASGGRIISNISDISSEIFGKAKKVEEIKKGDDRVTYIRGCSNPRAVTIVLRGGTNQIVDEIERAVKDGLGDVSAALNSKQIVAGGGAVEIEVSRQLRNFARTLEGREQLAVEEFANALESIPEALAENAGLDPIDILTELKQRHEAGNVRDGINLFNNRVEDTFQAGIVEPLKVKDQAISSASELATMILRIDDIFVSEGSGGNKKVEGSYQGID